MAGFNLKDLAPRQNVAAYLSIGADSDFFCEEMELFYF
jgi:hypothetical protein